MSNIRPDIKSAIKPDIWCSQVSGRPDIMAGYPATRPDISLILDIRLKGTKYPVGYLTYISGLLDAGYCNIQPIPDIWLFNRAGYPVAGYPVTGYPVVGYPANSIFYLALYITYIIHLNYDFKKEILKLQTYNNF